ncbi:MAG: alpha-beta hydrolase superfamily lysophospholipase [Halieaceae bacterium]|jgi:alpha-beta hydrolase superfamily lysophospholipase
MNERSGKFIGSDGSSLFFRYWCPEGTAKSVVVLVHGAGEHCGRYQMLAERFVARGFAVASYDQIGHGQSEGTPGHIDKFSDYLDSLDIFHRQVTADFPGQSHFLLGHSMGGLVGCNYLLEYQDKFIGCVLSGPAVKTELKPGFIQMLIIRTLSALFPKAGALGLDSAGVSRDPAVVEAYDKDPLVFHGKMSARKINELFKYMTRIQSRAAEITLPLLLLHGSEDTMAAPSGSVFLDESTASSDKTLHVYPGLYHEIFNEPEREEIFSEVLDWMDARLG